MVKENPLKNIVRLQKAGKQVGTLCVVHLNDLRIEVHGHPPVGHFGIVDGQMHIIAG